MRGKNEMRMQAKLSFHFKHTEKHFCLLVFTESVEVFFKLGIREGLNVVEEKPYVNSCCLFMFHLSEEIELLIQSFHLPILKEKI